MDTTPENVKRQLESVEKDIKEVKDALKEVKDEIKDVKNEIQSVGLEKVEDVLREKEKHLLPLERRAAALEERETMLVQAKLRLKNLELSAGDEPVTKRAKFEKPTKRARQEFSTNNYQQPSIGSNETPSKLSSVAMEKITTTGAIYSHWLAVALYNLIKSQLQQQSCMDVWSEEEHVSFTFEEETLKLKRSSIRRMVTWAKSILALPHHGQRKPGGSIMSDLLLQSSEMSLTALLSRELDRFLFPDPSVGACLHQLPVYAKYPDPERADFYILKFHDKLPDRPIGISDFKKGACGRAEKESFAYSSRLMCEPHSVEGEYICHLVFPCTCQLLKCNCI